MYKDVWELWLREITNREVQPIEKNFFSRLKLYVSDIKNRKYSGETPLIKSLHDLELKNIVRLVGKILDLRYKKIFHGIKSGEGMPTENILEEEREMIKCLEGAFEELSALKDGFTESHADGKKHCLNADGTMIRFLKDMPGIIGSDTRSYGPFKSEDVSYLPTESVHALIKRGIAVKIEVS